MACRYMALTSSPRHAPIQPEYTVSNASRRQRSVTAARSLAAADACSISEDQLSSRQPSAANVQQDDITRRRALHLSAAALLWVSAAQTLQSLPAVASPALGVQTAFKAGSTYSPAAADFEEFRGKGGFTLRRPANSGWVIAFNRDGSKGPGALALMGDFRTFDIVSAQRVQLASLNLPSDATSEQLAEAIVSQAEGMGSTMAFQRLHSGVRLGSDGREYGVREWSIEICKGTIVEGLEGVKTCTGPNDMQLVTLKRREVAAAVVKDGQGYVLSASSTQDRWPEIQATMHAVADSFQVA